MKSFTFGNVIARLAILALLLPVSLLSAQNPDSPAVTRLLEQVKSHSALADRDAETLTSYTRSGVGWRNHGAQLTLIKEHVNDLIEDGNQMSAMRDEASPWQQDAIDRINSVLPEMSSHLSATIDHLNDNQNRTHMKAFLDLVRTNQTIIHNAHEIISDYVDYSEAKAKADALAKELQLPAVPETAS